MSPFSSLKSVIEKEQQLENEELAYTLLIVDDEDANLRMLQRIFKNRYNILTAKNGLEALNLLKSDPNPERINLIISDQKMPIMTGVEFLEQSLEIVPKAIRMILTAYSDVDVIIDAINKGNVYKFIQKPFEINDMRITVKRALENFELEQQKTELIDNLQQEIQVRIEAEEKLQKLNMDLQQAMERLHQSLSRQAEAEKMAALGGLVAGITHEINTPMGISLTSASYLQGETSGLVKKIENGNLKRSDLESFQEKVEESIQIVVSNLKRAGDLIKSFKQVAVDQTSNKNRLFDLQAYLDEILLSLKPKLKRTLHRIQINCPKGLMIKSNPGAFSQIVTNFIVNSLIHGFDGIESGTIEIDISVVNNLLTLDYRDNGVGMEKNVLDHVFDPFFTTKQDIGGSGIGTHIVYNLVKQNLKGEISCESAPGDGVHFSIQIPLE